MTHVYTVCALLSSCAMDCRVKTGSRRLSQIDMICNELVIKLEPELSRMSDTRSEHSVFPLKRDSYKRTHDVQCREHVRNTNPQLQIKQEPGMAKNSDSAADMSKCLTGMYLDYSTTLLDGEGKSYECSECHVSFDHQNTHKKHMETHLEKKHTGRKSRREKAFLCSACPSALTTADGLKIHMRRHTGEKPYLCDECPATFADRSTLRKHQGRKHIDHNIFRCSECPAKFRIAEKLVIHMRKHTGEKPFKCSECPIAFTFASHLRAHTRIHTGEKPYKCMECFSAFSYSSTLKAHMRVHTGERPYRCTECPKAFASSSSLKYHVKVHTRDNSCLLPVKPVPHAGYQGQGLNHC